MGSLHCSTKLRNFDVIIFLNVNLRRYIITVLITLSASHCQSHKRRDWLTHFIFLVIKPTRCTNFLNLFLEWNSTCFGQVLCPSSGVFHCKHSNGVCHTGLGTACEQDQDETSWSCPQAVRKPLWHIQLLCVCLFVYFWRNGPQWAMASSFTRFLVHAQEAPLSVGLLWTNDQLIAETSTWQHSQQTNIHAPSRIRTHNLSRRAAADPRLRPRGHWEHVSSWSCSQAVRKPVWHIPLLCVCLFVCFWPWQPPVGQGLLIHKDSR